jgi:hypothetical protein
LLTQVSRWQERQTVSETGRRDSVPDAPLMGDFGPLDPEMPTVVYQQTPQGPLGDVRWDATWFLWEEGSDPRGDVENWRARRFNPLTRGEVRAWENPWGSDARTRDELPELNYGLIANGSMHITRPGDYILSALSDDGIRLIVDGQVVFEDWTWHPERRSSKKINLSAGSHSIELEYFQLDGTAVLSLDLEGPLGR